MLNDDEVRSRSVRVAQDKSGLFYWYFIFLLWHLVILESGAINKTALLKQDQKSIDLAKRQTKRQRQKEKKE